jgi:hypothetical protein
MLQKNRDSALLNSRGLPLPLSAWVLLSSESYIVAASSDEDMGRVMSMSARRVVRLSNCPKEKAEGKGSEAGTLGAQPSLASQVAQTSPGVALRCATSWWMNSVRKRVGE